LRDTQEHEGYVPRVFQKTPKGERRRDGIGVRESQFESVLEAAPSTESKGGKEKIKEEGVTKGRSHTGR